MLKLHSIEIVYPGDPALQDLAERLSRELASYRIPASVTKKTGLKSLGEVPESWLIVLCTPKTPECQEVRERIAAFTEEGRYNRILTLLVEGKPEESFPRELLFEARPDGTTVKHEPLAANITAPSRRESLRQLSVEKLRLLAPVLGVSFDELRNRRLRNRIRLAASLGAVVLLGAAAFFVYAFTRMTVISGQNQDLQLQYARAQEARDRTREQRDAAREEFAGTTAIRAREVLDRRNSELALLLCLEFLPEAGLTTDLPDILSEALQGLCRDGYVPVTSVREYGKNRYQPDPEPPEEEAGPFKKSISRPVPEEYDNGKDSFSMSLEAASEEYGYAVYSGSFYINRTSASDVYRSRVCFLNDPDRDYDMPCWNEPYKRITADVILPDGSFIGREHNSLEDYPFRYDPFAGEFLPFYDEKEENVSRAEADAFLTESGLREDGAGQEEQLAAEEPGNAAFLPADPDRCREAGIHVGDVPGTPAESGELFGSYVLESDIEKFVEIPGADGLIFGYTRTSTSDSGLEKDDVKTYVFSKEPFRYLYTIEDVISLFRPEQSRYILGMTGKKLLVFSAGNFRYLYTLEDEYTAKVSSYYYDVPHFPDGRSWLYVHITGGKAVYDLDTGKRMTAITDPGQEYSMEISSDGMILSSVRKVPVLWSPEDGSVVREIPGAEEDEPELFGTYDEATGRRGAEAIRIGSIVYEYREKALPVPEDLTGRIALARQLLNGRQLTRKERKTYSLELQEAPELP